MDVGRKLLKKYPMNVSETASKYDTDALFWAATNSFNRRDANIIADIYISIARLNTDTRIPLIAPTIWPYLSLIIYSNNNIRKTLIDARNSIDRIFFFMS